MRYVCDSLLDINYSNCHCAERKDVVVLPLTTQSYALVAPKGTKAPKWSALYPVVLGRWPESLRGKGTNVSLPHVKLLSLQWVFLDLHLLFCRCRTEGARASLSGAGWCKEFSRLLPPFPPPPGTDPPLGAPSPCPPPTLRNLTTGATYPLALQQQVTRALKACAGTAPSLPAPECLMALL